MLNFFSEDELVFDSDGCFDKNNCFDDDEDSNDENHHGNDYPDEDRFVFYQHVLVSKFEFLLRVFGGNGK